MLHGDQTRADRDHDHRCNPDPRRAATPLGGQDRRSRGSQRGCRCAADLLLQRSRKFCGVRITLVAIFLHAALNDRVQAGRNFRVDADRLPRLVADDLRHRLGGRLAAERKLLRRSLIQHDAERKKIGARIERFSEGLLGRHVVDGADDHSLLGEQRRGRSVG